MVQSNPKLVAIETRMDFLEEKIKEEIKIDKNSTHIYALVDFSHL